MNSENPIQRYKIQKKIGTGGMASVFLALDSVLNRNVAIKMVHPHLLQHPETLKRFSNEAQAIATLSHDNIVKIYDYGQSESQPFIVMEYIDGCALDALLANEKRLPCLVALEITRQILSGLICAHEKGVYHRDIKPGNIIVGSDGLVRITDFGIAYLVSAESVTLTGSFLGSPHYVSPEQVSNRKVSATTDIFSLGVLIYQCLTGVFPFDADTPHGTINAILTTDPPAPAVVNRQMILWLSDCIETFLVKDPERRPAARDAFARLDAAGKTDGLHAGKERLSAFVNNAQTARADELQELCSHYSNRARAAWKARQLPSALRHFEQARRFGSLGVSDVRLVATISRQSIVRRIVLVFAVIAGAVGLLYPVVSMIAGHRAESGGAVVEQADTRGIDQSSLPDQEKQFNGVVVVPRPVDTVRGNPASLPVENQPVVSAVTLQYPAMDTIPSRNSSATLENDAPVTPASTTGFFVCLTNPPWVTMYIDDIERGKTPTLSALPLPSGKHHMRLSKSKFADYSDTVIISATDTTRVRVKLDPLPQGSSAP